MADKSSAPQMAYIPVATAIPVFASYEPVTVPTAWQAIPSDMWSVMQNTHVYTVRQHTKIFPKSCCTCPPCVKQENTYSVYAGKDQDSQAEFLRVDEVSDDWNRCCCAPYHPVKLEVRPYVPLPGDNGRSDWSHISSDVAASWGTLTKQARSTAIKDLYKQYPPVMTFMRHDGQRCCFPVRSPCRWLNTFVCFQCCQDGMDVYAGTVNDNPKERGRPFEMEQYKDQLIGSVTQPIFGGFCHPELHLRTNDAVDPLPFGKLTGPCFFGGWSECCCNFRFPLSSMDSKDGGDLGVVTKQAPKSLAGAVRELMTEADVYSLEFNGNLSAAQKVTALASQLLVDYMIFEGNTEKCSQDENFIYCYCCYFMCFGALCPVYICIPKKVQ